MAHSPYLSSLDAEKRRHLEKRLLDRQGGKCFICDDVVDLVLHKGQLDIDHIDPLALNGLDAENNFALTHASCNRSKGADNLEVARRLKEFERLQDAAQKAGKRGANLGDVLERHGGSKAFLRLRRVGDFVEFATPEAGENSIRRVPIFRDKLSGMESFFTWLPLEYLHHDDRINPRSIGSNIRGLIEEFRQKRPQLHVGLAWWTPDDDQAGPVKVFDGQHKAAAQVLLGVRELPVRIFLEPDTNVLLQANTNAGGKLRQVAFDAAVMRHLGSSLYLDRVRKFQSMRGLDEGDYSFSERDLVKFFKGESAQMERYIVDAQRDAITRDPDNKLVEFIEWSGKGGDRPMSYSTLEKTFFSEFLYKKALESPIDEGIEQGTNPRLLERTQMIRLMSLLAETFFVSHWDPDLGGRRLENRLGDGESIPPSHLRAWRIAREEVLVNIVRWLRLVIANFFAYTGKVVREDRLLQAALPDELWARLRAFLASLAKLPCWIDPNLSTTVFGPKMNREYWEKVFQTGRAPTGQLILTKGLDLTQMIEDRTLPGGKKS